MQNKRPTSPEPGNLQALHPLPPTKTIMIYRNGDAFYPGRKMVINQRQISTFDTFLSTVTLGIQAPFGAVRNIYTPREGHRISEMDHLQHGDKYVAAGKERFKKLDYVQISAKKPQRKKTEQIQPVVHSKIVVPARWRVVGNESCTINVFTNGDVLVPPVRLLIPKYTLKNWENVLAMVTEKVRPRTGAVHRLCTLDGTPVLSGAELEHNHYYVAVGLERYRQLPYFQWVPNKGVNRDMSQGIMQSGDVLPPMKKRRQGKNTSAPSPSPPPPAGEDPELVGKGIRGLLKGRKHSLFYAASNEAAKQPTEPKPITPPSKVPPPPSVRVGDSVFKAKDRRKETAGAAEVQDDRRVRVDLPIDQVEAKTVDEEVDFPRPEGGGRSPLKGFSRRLSSRKSQQTPTAPAPASASRPESPDDSRVTPAGDSKQSSANGKPVKTPKRPPASQSPAPVPETPALKTPVRTPAKTPVKTPFRGGDNRPTTPVTPDSPVPLSDASPSPEPVEVAQGPKVERRASKLFGIRTRMSKLFKDKNKKTTSAPEPDALKPEGSQPQ
ncbi:doublecortin domain-containing protein 2 isoform X2 [Engraulis encrasicolus]|uniref:doublecortin domain-containing protein 2 isoform X2 n=1 Tax=Engraulis encrasicolus TaxID=184585 RepID=UPI002FD49DE1